jgi:hypothetical protein
LEKPDRRIVPLMIAMLVASLAWALIWAVVPRESTYLFYMELVLYLLTIAYGLAVGLLSTKLKYSVIKPSVTKSASPQMFVMEVWLGGYACAVFGAWLLYRLIK